MLLLFRSFDGAKQSAGVHVLTVRFEDMVMDARRMVSQVLAFAGAATTDEELDTIVASIEEGNAHVQTRQVAVKSDDQLVSSWKKKLSAKQKRMVAKHCGEACSAMGYSC